MIHPAADLQKAIYGALSSSAELVTVLGGTKIHDHNPDKAELPYIVLGLATSTDWSTASEDGKQHDVSIHVWSKLFARKEIQQIQQLVYEALHDQNLAAQDHVIINLRQQFSDMRWDEKSGHMHGISRFRAITEPKP